MLRQSIIVFIGVAAWWILSTAALAADTTVLPRPQPPFTGQLAPSVKDSTPYSLTKKSEAPDGAPNVLLIMTDDVGFGSVSTFGGPIPKPNLDRLAERGLVYNRFHTAGVCSPTRASLLTGRNHHAAGMGALVEMTSAYPGYTGIIPPDAATVSRILRDNGYNTAMFGKDHNVPSDHRSPAGPFYQWPTGRGFEYFYGFVSGDTNQWNPSLFLGTSPVDGSHREEDYIFDRDVVDRTIQWIHNQKAAAPDKPFFVYHALGTAHGPQQAPEEWIEKFRGKFDHGWDEQRKRTLARQKARGIVPDNTRLAARPDEIPAWDSLSAAEQKVYARFMEVYAGMLAYQDAQLGRLLDELERMGIADNTLVIYIEGDNGSAGEVGIHGSLNELIDITAPTSERNYDLEWLAENLHVMGGPETYQAMPAGWSFAMNTPFPWMKQVASHLGATRNGLVISWPNGLQRSGLRNQYHHVIDILPTILDAAGIKAPTEVDGIEQQPIDGTSMVYSFADADAPSPRNTQHYELMGNRSIYHDGWFANTVPRNMPWDISRAGAGTDTSTYEWELYDLRSDFSQSRNLADQHPDRLREMQKIFDAEARENKVYPLQNAGARHRQQSKTGAERPRMEYTYWGPDIRIPRVSAPPIFWVPFSLETTIVVPEDGAEGVIFAAGSHFGGWSFYLDQSRPVVAASSSPQPGGLHRVTADEALAPGTHTLRFDVAFKDRGARVKITADGTELAETTLDQRPTSVAGGSETFDTGRDTNTPVSPDYENEGAFTGTIQKVLVQLKPR